MGAREIHRDLEQWEMDAKALRRRMILAPTPRERERWYAVWLLAQGWTAAATAEALERDPHTIGRWASAFGEGGPAALIFEQSGGSSFSGVSPLPRATASASCLNDGSPAGWGIETPAPVKRTNWLLLQASNKGLGKSIPLIFMRVWHLLPWHLGPSGIPFITRWLGTAPRTVDCSVAYPPPSESSAPSPLLQETYAHGTTPAGRSIFESEDHFLRGRSSLWYLERRLYS